LLGAIVVTLAVFRVKVDEVSQHASSTPRADDEPFAPWWHSDQLPSFPPHVAATRV
jgi:hypothetical protein